MAELFANLGINAKLLVAQIINFAILFLILQKFAYKPIIGMLNRRRADIETANKRADEMESRINGIEEAKDVALVEARNESSALIKKAEVDAVKNAEKIMANAKAENEKLAQEGRARIAQDREKLKEELKRELGETLVMAIEKSVGDVLDEKGKAKLVEQAMHKTKTRS